MEQFITTLCALYLAHPEVTTDSRVCPSGSLFFALKGDRFDGNLYAAGALSAGCAFAIVDDASVIPAEAVASRSATGLPTVGLHGTYFLVPDVLQALQQLAACHREHFRTWSRPVPVVGITGTNGKTTTKELLNAVLSRKYKVLATAGNLNNQIGVPLTLLKVSQQHELVIVEMGANHPMDIADLCAITRPDFGLITNVGKAHLLGFGSFEGVIEAKARLYESLRLTGGTAFVDAGNEYLTPKVGRLSAITYGRSDASFCASLPAPAVTGSMTECSPYLRLNLSVGAETYAVSTHLIGDYNLINVVAAATVGHALGVASAAICEAIEGYTPANMRSQLLQLGFDQKIILDAYNANPTSMMAALHSFALNTDPHKSLILGDMRELGADSVAEHLHVLEYLMTTDFGDILLVGAEFGKAFAALDEAQLAALGRSRNVRCYATVADLCSDTHVLRYLCGTLLVKGSRGIALEKAVDVMRQLCEAQ